MHFALNCHFDQSVHLHPYFSCSGDHDMMIPYIGTLQWIRDLNLTLEEDWRPWFLNGQIAGFVFKFLAVFKSCFLLLLKIFPTKSQYMRFISNQIFKKLSLSGTH